MMRSIVISLPQDLIFDEILARLPVKSLVRFKTVCRSWYFTISSPEFAKTHLAFSSSRQLFLIDNFECLRDGRSLRLVPYKEGNNNVDDIRELARLSARRNDPPTCLVGCCNGIVCLCLYTHHRRVGGYMIWNPATHEYRVIDNPYSDCEVKAFGFGYATSIDDYKIAVIYCDSKEKHNRVYLYSLKTRTWKNIFVTTDDYDREYSLFYGSKIYWRRTETVVAVDLVTEKWEEHSLINWLRLYKCVDFFVAQQRLALICKAPYRNNLDLWMMDKSGDWNSWYKVVNNDLVPPNYLLKVYETGIYLTTNGCHKLDFIDVAGQTSRPAYSFTEYFCNVQKSGFYFDTLISPF
ncbi:hypothetical protein vseg_018475 [Gypsophila vaccaria]